MFGPQTTLGAKVAWLQVNDVLLPLLKNIHPHMFRVKMVIVVIVIGFLLIHSDSNAAANISENTLILNSLKILLSCVYSVWRFFSTLKLLV